MTWKDSGRTRARCKKKDGKSVSGRSIWSISALREIARAKEGRERLDAPV